MKFTNWMKPANDNFMKPTQEYLRKHRLMISPEAVPAIPQINQCDCGPTCEDIGGGRCRYANGIDDLPWPGMDRT